ncbi:MAG: metal-dependent hydrolase [Isosphaeraceae bacterium]
MATRIQWLGHATLLIESDGRTILIDPFLDDNPSAPFKADAVSPDFILVSHGHFDHIADAIPIARRTGATVVANFEIAQWLQGQGLENVHGMQHGGGFGFPFGRLKMTIAFHGSVLPDGTYGGNPAGFHLALNDGCKIYDAADTALFSDMLLIGEQGIDLACLPIGDNFTMGPDDSIRAIGLLQPAQVMPIHYNTWPVIQQDAARWAERVGFETRAEPIVPKVGEWVQVR